MIVIATTASNTPISIHAKSCKRIACAIRSSFLHAPYSLFVLHTWSAMLGPVSSLLEASDACRRPLNLN
jgi:hypothetical protein